MEDAMKWLLFPAIFVLLCPQWTTGHQMEKRQAKKFDFMLWMNGKVYYRIISPFTSAEKKMIREAMDTWEALTCVKFVKTTEKIPVTVDIQRNKSQCFSLVGSLQTLLKLVKSDEVRRQPLNLGLNCMQPSIITHELGHSLGLYHEHERTIRDRYVELFKQNIQEKYLNQFKIQPMQRNFGLPYSYRSIMHYGKSYFAKGKGISMLAKDPKFVDIIGKARMPSFKDVQIVNRMYRCDKDCRNNKPCPEGATRGANCRCWCKSELFSAVDCETGEAVDKRQVKHSTGTVLKFRSGETFFWSNDQVDWFVADQGCKLLDGHLVNVETAKVDSRLSLMYKKLRESNVYEKINIPLFWTGGNDQSEEGKFKWTNKEAVNDKILTFPRGEPNNQLNEDCLAFASLPQGNKYVDWDCGYPHNFVCELPKSGCHDKSTMCKYYKKIGQCHTDSSKRLCQKSCSLCSKKKVPEVILETTPEPSEEMTTLQSAESTEEPSTEESTPSQAQTTTEPTPEQQTTSAPTKPTELVTTATPQKQSRRCYRAGCTSHLMHPSILSLDEGSKFCIRCPACGCRFARVIGLGTYWMGSRVCCAIKQAKGRSRGVHTLTREGRRPFLIGGMKYGIRSGSYTRRTVATFSVNVDSTVRSAALPNSCHVLTCRQSLLRQSWFTNLRIKSVFCVKCPECACSSVRLIGFRRYAQKSPVCCSVKQIKGKSEGEHPLRRSGSAVLLMGDTANNITSRSTFGPWPYTYKILTTNKKCTSAKIQMNCAHSLVASRAWTDLAVGEQMCVQCSDCRCKGNRNSRFAVFGFGVYHPLSSTCCAAKQVKGRSEGIHGIRKIRGRRFYRSGILHGVRSTRQRSKHPWAFVIS